MEQFSPIDMGHQSLGIFPENLSLSFKQKSQIRKSHQHQIIKKKIVSEDPLNDWKYCNPENQDDSLPYPYKFIDRCLNDMILKPVYCQIFEIEKQKNNPNYEGHLKHGAPSGSFDIDGISYLCCDQINPYNQIIAGDKLGNIYLLDLNKKVQIYKQQVVQGKRIIHICSSTVKYCDGLYCIFSVILRADPNIYIYRFKPNENKFYLHFIIKPSNPHREIMSKFDQDQNSTQDINLNQIEIDCFPFQSFISYEGKYIAISFYSGNIEIFQLDDPPISTQQVAIDQEQEKIQKATFMSQKQQSLLQQQKIHQQNENMDTISSDTESNKSSKVQSPQHQFTHQQYQLKGGKASLFEFSPKDITLPYYKLNAKLVKKEQKYNDVLNNIIKKAEDQQQDPVQQQQQQQQLKQQQKIQQQQQQPQKKGQIPAKGGKVQQQQVVEEQLYDPYERNVKQFIVQKIVDPQTKQDITPDYISPYFRANIHFVTQDYILENVSHTFNQFKTIKVTCGFFVVWIQNQIFEYHVLQAVNRQTVPEYLKIAQIKQYGSQQASMNNLQEEKSQISELSIASQKLKINQPPLVNPQFSFEVINPKLVKQNFTLYKISCSQMSNSGKFIGIGLADGTIMLWNVDLESEVQYLDKHQKYVTSLQFYKDQRIISGGFDGTVYIYDIVNEKNIMKRTQLFKPKKKIHIVAISVSPSGIALALDNFGNLRMYDLIRGQKIQKVFAYFKDEMSNKKWLTQPYSILIGQKEQFCVVSQYSQQMEETKFITQIQILKTFDNIINIFPGLSNQYRKGADKHKIWDLFYQLSFEELQNPKLESVIIGPDNNEEKKNQQKQQPKQIIQTKSSFYEQSQKQKTTVTQMKKTQSSLMKESSQGSVSYPDPLMRSDTSSVMESHFDMNSSFNTKARTLKQSTMQQQQQYPQKYIYILQISPNKQIQSQDAKQVELKIANDEQYNSSKNTLNMTRKRNQKKQIRADQIQNKIEKIGVQLQQQDEKIKKEQKNQLMISQQTLKQKQKI